MGSLFGILFLLIVRTVAAGVVIQPTYPFETDVSKYKLLEEFYPENDRNAIPIGEFLERVRAAKASEQALKIAESDRTGYPPFANMRALSGLTKPSKFAKAFEYALRRNMVPAEEDFLGEVIDNFVKCLMETLMKKTFPKGASSGQRAVASFRDDSKEISEVANQAIMDLVAKLMELLMKKVPFMKLFGQ